MFNSATLPRSATLVLPALHALAGRVQFLRRPSLGLRSSPASDDETAPPMHGFAGLPRQRTSEPTLSPTYLHRRREVKPDSPGALGHHTELPSASWRYQRGIAVVEFALVLPVLLLLVFGIVEFALAMYDKAVITNASREAARAGVVLKNPKMSTAQIQDVALNYCQNYLITLNGTAKPTVSVPSGQGGSFGTPLTVTVSYTYSGLALGAIISPLIGPLQLSATSVMNNE